MSSNEIPLFNVPYPPELTVEEIISRRSYEKIGSRAPNQFFLYRLAYIKELKRRFGNNITMTKASPYISLSWSKEPPEVKETYKRLSAMVENRLKEIRKIDDPLVIIQENFSPPPPPPMNNDVVEEPIFFYPYFDYDYDCNYFYYDYYNYYYFY
ncbi:hypothetical protein RclHR1_00850021 [Rhizophagus clarus]|uniref:Kinase-like domain-containing protein n=1 Tax=Rhizophagus clarus TaxID=94130 RepID=A0A2Z6SFC7_9GLOM|nr:hypothetical protein RclHR1_00850021 [Rhizophagus clarus]GES98093.1 kinase-like domain-containing protein [Rhizophagus clarus]